MKNLREAILHIVGNKQLAAVFAKKIGVATFAECRPLIEEGLLDNGSNRDEDLDTPVKYWGKLHHLIRFLMAISEKGQLLISVLKDTTDKVGFIRDNGTMFSLVFGTYYTQKVLNGHEWLSICDDIVESYDINEEQDKELTNLLESYFQSLTAEQLDLKYSVKDIFTSSKRLIEIYDNCEISFVVNLHNSKQFAKDMINCNRQPNPWIAYNFYMTPLKRTNEYKTTFLGKELIEYFESKFGAHIFKKGELMNGHKTMAEKHKVARMIPILQSYIGSRYCNTLEQFKTFNEMVMAFEGGTDDGKENEYWSEMFKKVVRDASYQDIVDFYENEYLKVFKSDKWLEVNECMLTIKSKNNWNAIPTALSDLHVKKYHTGILILTFVLYFKRLKSKGWDKTINAVIDEYVRLLEGDVTYNGIAIAVDNFFGNDASLYQSTSGNVRWDKIFQFLFKNVTNDFNNRSKDRNLEAEYRAQVLSRIGNFMDNEQLIPRMKIYPIHGDVASVISWKTGEGLHWLHKNPHDTGGDAKDGFLGLIDDNLGQLTKKLNWTCTPNEYVILLAERNELILEKLPDGREKKSLKNAIETLYQLEESLNLGV